MKVAAVVVTYNRKELLKECLQALLSQTMPLDEIIVIDNASTDGTHQTIFKQFPQVTYIRLPENIGGAGGFHEGMKLAYKKGYDWIWVMDDDAIVLPDGLEILIKCINKQGSTDCIGGVRPLTTAGHFTPLFAGGLISRKAIETVGLPRSDFFIYWDDVEYEWRIQRNGLKFISSDNVIAKHEHWLNQPRRHVHVLGIAVSRPSLPDWKVYYLKRNAIPAMISNGKFLALIKFLTLEMLKDVIVYALLREWNKLSYILLGIIDGLLGRMGRRVTPGS